MNSRFPWDQYEAALLVDTYNSVRNGQQTRECAVKGLSDLLRQYGRAKGLLIDDIYRNENGISMRLSEIDHLFTKGQGGLKNTSKLFIDTVALYNEHRSDFDQLLIEAKRITSKDRLRKALFQKWLGSQESLIESPETVVYIIDAGSNYAVSHGLTQLSFWNIDDSVEYEYICAKVVNSYLFRVFHRNTSVGFKKYWVYYKEYLLSITSHKKEAKPSKEPVRVDSAAEHVDTLDSLPDETGSGTDKEKSQSEDGTKVLRFYHEGQERDEIIRKKNPALYDLVRTTLAKLCQENPKGASFLDVYDQIEHDFSDIKDMLKAVSWAVPAPRGKRYLFVESQSDSQEETAKPSEQQAVPLEIEREPDDVRITEAIVTDTSNKEHETSQPVPGDDESSADNSSNASEEDTQELMPGESTDSSQGGNIIVLADSDSQSEMHEVVNSQPTNTTPHELKSVCSVPTEASSDLPDVESLDDKLFVLLKSISDKNAYGTTLYYLATTVNTSEVKAKKLLNAADWATCEYGRYKFNYSALKQGEMKYDFIKQQSLACTKPVSLSYFRKRSISPKSWRQLYVESLKMLYKDYPRFLSDLKGISFGDARFPLIADHYSALKMSAPKEVGNGLFVETDRPAGELITSLKWILSSCSVDYENVVIKYARSVAGDPINQTVPQTNEQNTRKTESIRIVDAAAIVLKAASAPMTIKEIYDQIVKEKLYVFGAQDPEHVVEVKINAACKGSGYTNRSAQELFGFIREGNAKKYYLLSREHEFVKPQTDQEKPAVQTTLYVRTDTDIELQKSYPILFKRVYLALRNYGSSIVSANVICEAVNKCARLSTVKHVLDYASWSEHVGENYRYSPNPIHYTLKGDSSSQEETAQKGSNKIAAILRAHYQYGFKYESIREMMRFRQFASEMEIPLPDSDEQLKMIILATGTVIGDKVFCQSEDFSEVLQSMIDKAFSTGPRVAFYASLLELESEKMSQHAITSEDMLKEYLQKHVTGYAFSKKFLAKGYKKPEKEAVTEEIKRVWGNTQLNYVTELHKRLPYIPLSNIWRAISGNDEFVFSAEDQYLLLSRFRINEDQRKAIRDYVETACNEKGCINLYDIPIDDLAEENYELSRTVICNAVYKLVLRKHYFMNGKILAKDFSKLNFTSVLKQIVSEAQECTIDEIMEKATELTGVVNRQNVLQLLYDEMIRVDKNRFVACNLVRFNIEETDAVLSQFIPDRFVSIRRVTTFAMFPFCGQGWNHYLLESYCYRYSKKYSLHVTNWNDKNAGIISEQLFNKKYDEMLAIELARSNTKLDAAAAGEYLFANGYMASSKSSKLSDIVQLAGKIRKEIQ